MLTTDICGREKVQDERGDHSVVVLTPVSPMDLAFECVIQRPKGHGREVRSNAVLSCVTGAFSLEFNGVYLGERENSGADAAIPLNDRKSWRKMGKRHMRAMNGPPFFVSPESLRGSAEPPFFCSDCSLSEGQILQLGFN